MEFQNYIRIGLQKFIERLIDFTLVMEFYSIMRAHEEAKHLLQEKLLCTLQKRF